MNEEQRRTAADYVLRQMGKRGWDLARLAVEAGIADPSTLRTFLAGATWPQRPTRQRIEDALGLTSGTLETVALLGPPDVEDQGDSVITAIEGSALSRANQHRLIGRYYELLEEQERRGSA